MIGVFFLGVIIGASLMMIATILISDHWGD